jgi:hypothetical protein
MELEELDGTRAQRGDDGARVDLHKEYKRLGMAVSQEHEIMPTHTHSYIYYYKKESSRTKADQPERGEEPLE